jgi:hypothetical protein
MKNRIKKINELAKLIDSRFLSIFDEYSEFKKYYWYCTIDIRHTSECLDIRVSREVSNKLSELNTVIALQNSRYTFCKLIMESHYFGQNGTQIGLLDIEKLNLVNIEDFQNILKYYILCNAE